MYLKNEYQTGEHTYTSGHKIKLPTKATISGSAKLSQALTTPTPSSAFRNICRMTINTASSAVSQQYFHRTHIYNVSLDKGSDPLHMSPYPVLRNCAIGSQETAENGENKVK